ncbi:2-isopropylmalate synthase [Saccharophagus degradans]|uniref:2-isopropylmalate synthase n=1 Tax=Saccharophagus degradans TaxID=86304 RepID=UPI001C09E51A|nr:2-isopropylmalate synthase [Saccharophagus degradans]MBU2985218.1 2-isopropylmalate synthase [Saccharophagus degradans]
MLAQPAQKYRPFKGVQLADRQWPNRTIEKPPIWMSTDLRDGNQALIDPMSVETKLTFFKEIVAMNFKEIEIGFPSASDTDFQFTRRLIDEGHIPEDVTIEVLVQARKELIERTVESVRGAKRVIIHMYNPTAPSFRSIVYKTDKAGVKNIAVQGTKWVMEATAKAPEVEWVYQYSPEVFSGTEIEFAKEVVDAVSATWQPTPENKMIINLPATVEMGTPNTYADQIEWMHRYIERRDSIVLSVHPHNDRGTAVAAAELAVMAGADRVEGCLFGNGERTGNVDLVTLALNLYTQGVHPGLDFSDIDKVRKLVETCNQIPVHPRHPYAGELVFTAFSGSHQDAIKKGFAQRKDGEIWEVPYLPIDPKDLNRDYDAVVRVNSQSGKGGVSFLLQQKAGLELPRRLQIEFSGIVQKINDETGKEMTAAQIVDVFQQEYFGATQGFEYIACHVSDSKNIAEGMQVEVELIKQGEAFTVVGEGSGPIDAAVTALTKVVPAGVSVVDYHEHAVREGADGEAVCYVELKVGNGRPVFGVGRHKNIVVAAVRAMVGGVNRAS